jgi:hypothetical protein
MFDNGYDGPSILKPQGIAAIVERTSIEDLALFVIALARKARETEAAEKLARESNAFAQRCSNKTRSRVCLPIKSNQLSSFSIP